MTNNETRRFPAKIRSQFYNFAFLARQERTKLSLRRPVVKNGGIVASQAPKVFKYSTFEGAFIANDFLRNSSVQHLKWH